MRAFTYERAGDVGEPPCAAAGRAGAQVHRGGTNLLDLMKLEIERPAHLVDISRLPLDRDRETRRRRAAHRRPVRNTDLAADRRVRDALSGAVAGAARRRLGRSCATRPRPAATCCSARAAPTSTTPPCPATSASPARGCAALGGLQPHARDPRRERRLHRRPSVRHGGRAGRARRRGRDAVRPTGAARAIPIGDFHRLPGDTPQRRDRARARRADHRRRPAAAAARPADLPQGARPRLLRVRAGVGRGHRRRASGGGIRARADRVRRRRPQAVARARGRSARWPARRRGRARFDAAARRPLSRGAAAMATTTSRSRWPQRTVARALADAAGTRKADHGRHR